MAKILLLPSDHGGGMGHVSRCMYLARLAYQNNHEPGIVLEKKHYNKNKAITDFQVFKFSIKSELFARFQFKQPFFPQVKLKKIPMSNPVFVEFSSLAWQIPRDGYISPKIILKRLRLLSRIVEKFKPDILIGDTHFLAAILAKKYDIPIIQITRKAGYPLKPEFMWWKSDLPEWIAPNALAPFYEILNDYYFGEVNNIEQLLFGNRYLIPAISEIEPITCDNTELVYSGPLTEIPDNIQWNDNRNKVYISVGGGSSRGRLADFFRLILSAFKGTSFNALVSTAGYLPAVKFNIENNILFKDWVDGKKAIAEHNLIIFHGGYGSMMEILSTGRKSVVIPSHTEQEGNGRRIETLGIGKVLPFTNKINNSLEFRWPYGDYQMGAAYENEILPEQLYQTCLELVEKDISDETNSISESLRNAKNNFDFNKLINI